jgi:hypothetical protein
MQKVNKLSINMVSIQVDNSKLFPSLQKFTDGDNDILHCDKAKESSF